MFTLISGVFLKLRNCLLKFLSKWGVYNFKAGDSSRQNPHKVHFNSSKTLLKLFLISLVIIQEALKVSLNCPELFVNNIVNTYNIVNPYILYRKNYDGISNSNFFQKDLERSQYNKVWNEFVSKYKDRTSTICIHPILIFLAEYFLRKHNGEREEEKFGKSCFHKDAKVV